MNVFLVLSSSAVAFYVFILLALWRDSRKQRRRHVVSSLSTDLGEVWRFATERSNTSSHSRRFKFSDDVLWLPVAKLHMGGQRSKAQREPTVVPATAAKTSVH
jgi:hypothetical protein